MYALNALYANADQYPFTSEDLAIAKVMTAYWSNFIKTGNPNTSGSDKTGSTSVTHWYPNDGKSNYVMHLGDGWGNHTVAPEAGVKLIMDYFHQQTPY
jgi:carboxylesterase 2